MDCLKCPVRQECLQWKDDQLRLYKPDISDILNSFCPLSTYDVMKTIKEKAAQLALEARTHDEGQG